MGKIKERIKGYHIFLPKGWKRAAIYIVFPLLIMGICIVAGLKWPALTYVPILPGTCILWADGVIYFLLFGGFAEKDSKHMEYMKSSDRGITLYHRGLVTDAFRRLVSIGMIFLTIAVTVFGSLDTKTALLLAGAFSITCLTVFIASFIMGFLQNITWAALALGLISLGYNASMIAFSSPVLNGMNTGLLAAIIALIGLLAILLIKGQIFFLLKRMKGWYYDN